MIHDYQRNGGSKYGAWMGRKSDLPHDSTGPLTIRKVPLDEGGYDSGGAYWGDPDDLYVATDEDGYTAYVRAKSIAAARAQFPRASWTTCADVSQWDIADMVRGYVTCALWSTNDESTESGGVPLDENYSEDDIAPETLEAMRAECERFARANLADIIACLESGEHAIDWSRVGHDLWLTRNGHGAGFWDGDYPEPQAERLTKAAHDMREVYLYVGDDGRIYQ
jgi:hypothetical protein